MAIHLAGVMARHVALYVAPGKSALERQRLGWRRIRATSRSRTMSRAALFGAGGALKKLRHFGTSGSSPGVWYADCRAERPREKWGRMGHPLRNDQCMTRSQGPSRGAGRCALAQSGTFWNIPCERHHRSGGNGASAPTTNAYSLVKELCGYAPSPQPSPSPRRLHPWTRGEGGKTRGPSII